MEISSFLLFDDHDAYSTAILSCRDRWNYKFKPKIDGYKIQKKSQIGHLKWYDMTIIYV
jgi:hypothetical protein